MLNKYCLFGEIEDAEVVRQPPQQPLHDLHIVLALQHPVQSRLRDCAVVVGHEVDEVFEDGEPVETDFVGAVATEVEEGLFVGVEESLVHESAHSGQRKEERTLHLVVLVFRDFLEEVQIVSKISRVLQNDIPRLQLLVTK